MKIALVDSGIGLLAAAAAVRGLRPDADLVLSSDPDGMPWGPRSRHEVATRALACARAATEYQPDALIVACNTASVHALEALRAELEPRFPVIGTVPAIKPAAVLGGPAAIWATPATTGSAYQHGLIREFASDIEVIEVACPGLADAVESADMVAVDAAVRLAAERTPADVATIVLGCTHYELVAECIREAVAAPAPTLLGSATAVASQALRRAVPASAQGTASLTVVLSGQPCTLPTVAYAYAEGRLLAGSPDPVG